MPTRWRHSLRSAAAMLLLLAVSALAATAPAEAARAPREPSGATRGLDPALYRVAVRHPGRRVVVIIQFAPGVSATRARSIVRARGGRDESVIPLIHGIAATMSARSALGFVGLKSVHAVSLNSAVHAQATTLNAASLATWFNRSAATGNLWNTYTGAGIGVAVLDTGVDGNLPDFQASSGGTGSRAIGSAVVNPAATTAADTYGHGTMVAGLIAGNGFNRSSTDPLYGEYAGAAPGANIVSVKVSDDQGNATVLDVLYGLQFAIDHKSDYNIRVINLSVRSASAQSYTTDPLDAAVEAAWFDGITVVAAAGNTGLGGGVDYSPANDPYVITAGALGDEQTMLQTAHAVQTWYQQQIAALRLQGQPTQALQQQQQQIVSALQQAAGLPAPWSSSGATQDGFAKPELYGPGRFITAPLAPNSVFSTKCPVCIVNAQYITASGTSLAAPIVSGAVAELLQANPGWTPAMVKGALMSTSVAPPGYPAGSAGLLNGAAALGAASGGLSSDLGLTPSSLVIPSDGNGGSPSWSNWSRSSWSTAQGSQSAPWARSSWSCTCSGAGEGPLGTTRSSWSAMSWTIDFADVASAL